MSKYKCFYEDEPKNGKAFVAIFDDLSGANIFIRDDNGNILDMNGEFLSQSWFVDSGYIWFTYLTDGFDKMIMDKLN